MMLNNPCKSYNTHINNDSLIQLYPQAYNTHITNNDSLIQLHPQATFSSTPKHTNK